MEGPTLLKLFNNPTAAAKTLKTRKVEVKASHQGSWVLAWAILDLSIILVKAVESRYLKAEPCSLDQEVAQKHRQANTINSS